MFWHVTCHIRATNMRSSQMKTLMSYIIAIITMLVMSSANANEKTKTTGTITTIFSTKGYDFNESEMNVIHSIIVHAESRVRTLLPNLDKAITVHINAIDRDMDIVGGVFGRAEAPGEVGFYLSTKTKGGVVASATTSLTSATFHELHHLARGWTMRENKFGNPAGIPVATVNEGLASVFADTYTNEYFDKAYGYPDNAAEWLDEIMKLPKDANYGHWVGGFHPDGRFAIGYRVGRYVVHQAMKNSGKSILELSEISPQAILDFAMANK